MDTDGVIQIISLVILLILSAIFSSSETALTKANRVRLSELADLGNKRAKKALKLLANPGKMLSTVLVCNNIVNLSASALVTTLAVKIGGNYAVAIGTGALTLVLLIFGEITPKTLATVHSESLALIFSGFILFLSKILTPVIFIVDGFANGILKLFHINVKEVRSAITEFEFRTLVEESVKDGVLETEEREMINNVVDFGDSTAKDIMIPKVDMTCVSVNASYAELKDVFRKEKFTRLPVYEEDTDNIIGVINMKDVLFLEDYSHFSLRNIMREPNFTFEYKKTSDLMVEMRTKQIPMMLVLDEYGATVGLITLEDLLEEIVGEIRDEYDDYEKDLIKEVGENEYVVEGSMKLSDVNDALDTTLESEDFDSLGGLIIQQLDDLPEEGQSVTLDDGTKLTVVEMEKNHIEKVHMLLPEKTADDEADEVNTDDGSSGGHGQEEGNNNTDNEAGDR